MQTGPVCTVLMEFQSSVGERFGRTEKGAIEFAEDGLEKLANKQTVTPPK